MSDKTATVHWEGRGKQGVGNISTQTEALKSYPYGFASRFEDDKRGTNPEELLAAAHAGCFTMKLSLDLTTAGFTPDTLETTAIITLDNGIITASDLVLSAKIPGISDAEFQTIAAGAKAECPVSKAYNMKINLTASLVD